MKIKLKWKTLHESPLLCSFDGENGAGGDGAGESGGAGGSGEGGSTPWSDALPENVRSWEEVGTSDSPDKFWEQMGNMRSNMGNSIRIPGEEATPEDKAAFHAKLLGKVPGILPAPDRENSEQMEAYYKATGRPDSAEAYKIPEGATAVDTKAFSEMAFKHGISQDAFTGIMTDLNSSVSIENENQENSRKEGITALNNEWGKAFDKKQAQALRLAETTGAPAGMIEAIKDKEVGADTLKWLDNLASKFGGEGNIDLQEHGPGSDGYVTPAEAESQIQEIMANKAYWDKSAPDHKRLLKKVIDLQFMITPDEQSA